MNLVLHKTPCLPLVQTFILAATLKTFKRSFRELRRRQFASRLSSGGPVPVWMKKSRWGFKLKNPVIGVNPQEQSSLARSLWPEARGPFALREARTYG